MLTFGLANNAHAALASASIDIHQDAWDPVNDLHITYKSDVIMSIVSHSDGPFPNFSATPFDNASHGMGSGWECTWSGAWIPYCQTVTVGVAFNQQGVNTIDMQDVYFTINKKKASEDLPVPGFEITPPAGPADSLIYTLINTTTVPFVVSNPKFRFRPKLTPLDSMLYGMNDFDIPGPSEISLNPGDSFQMVLAVPPDRQNGSYFVMAQGTVSGPTGKGHFVQQHEHAPTHHPFLTVSEWGMIIFGVVLLGFITWVFLRRRKAAVSLR
jgi:hypothetical protein